MSGRRPLDRPRRRDVLGWIAVGVAIVALGAVGWALATAWGGVVHSHPAYALLLGVGVLLAGLAIWLGLRGARHRRGVWPLAGRIALVVLAASGIALIARARPHPAVEPALAAMVGDESVVVTETATRIVLTPVDGADGTGLFFQPGALVDPRAYAAVLRPIAADGHTVVITKPPLGIAFLALGDLDRVRAEHPEVASWVVGGHSLGGTVAAIQAEGAQRAAASPAAGLLLFASYPASDLSGTLTIPVRSISGSDDGLATPARIAASRADLPAGTEFVEIAGASHAQFGDYGPQAGDGVPALTQDEARARISQAALEFVAAIRS